MIHIIKLLFLYIAYQLSFYAVSTGVYMFVNNGSFDFGLLNESSTNIYVIIASQFFSTLALGIHLLVGKYARINELRLISGNSTKILLSSVILIIGMGMWVNYLSEIANLTDNMKEVFSLMMKNPFGIISIVILAPLVEELFFRGAIQGFLMQRYSKPYCGIIISSLIFGVMHANPAQIPFAFILGMVLGWVYYLTGSLLPGILMHFVNNGSAVLLGYIYDNPDTSMRVCFGENGAMTIALLGFVVSVIMILFIKVKLVGKNIS